MTSFYDRKLCHFQAETFGLKEVNTVIDTTSPWTEEQRKSVWGLSVSFTDLRTVPSVGPCTVYRNGCLYTESVPVKDLVLPWSKVKLFRPPGYQGCCFTFKSVNVTGPSPSTNTSTGQNLQSPTQNFGNSFKMYFKSNSRIPKNVGCVVDAIPNLKKMNFYIFSNVIIVLQ